MFDFFKKRTKEEKLWHKLSQSLILWKEDPTRKGPYRGMLRPEDPYFDDDLDLYIDTQAVDGIYTVILTLERNGHSLILTETNKDAEKLWEDAMNQNQKRKLYTEELDYFLSLF